MSHVQWFHWGSRSLASVRNLSGLSMLVAMYVALSFFTIPLSPTLRVSFSFLALALGGYLYGMIPSLLFAFAADFLGFIVHPDGAYMPLFALVLMAKAAIYALFFYRQEKISIPRILLAQFLASLICNIFLNPILLQIMYQTPYWALLLSRVSKNLMLFPVECVLLYLVLHAAQKLNRQSKVSL